MKNRSQTMAISGLLSALLLWAGAPPALATEEPSGEAQSPPPTFEEVGLWLARLYVSEAGFDGARDHAAIFHAVQNGAAQRGIPIWEQIQDYGRGLRAAGRRAVWVRNLRVDTEAPEGWGAPGSGSVGLDWALFHRKFERVLVRARTDLIFAPMNPCDGIPRHWGGMRIAVDRERAAKAVREGRWKPLHCGPTQNGFFAQVHASRIIE